MNLVRKLLEADRATLKLLGLDPFAGRRPMLVRALLYEYRYTDRSARRETGAWWTRRLIDVCLRPVSLTAFARSSQ